MKLTTVYFKGQSESGLPYIKAMVNVADVPFFEKLGAVLTQAEAEVIITEKSAEVSPGDKGHGKPGSVDFHKNFIMSFDKPDEVIAYVKEVTGEDIPKRGKLETIQKRALSAIVRFTDDSQN